MGEFKQACQELKILLFVLPPATPKYNGGVERANKIIREEFYDDLRLLANSVEDMRVEVNQMLKKYNEYHLHNVLNGLTHLQYILQYILSSPRLLNQVKAREFGFIRFNKGKRSSVI